VYYEHGQVDIDDAFDEQRDDEAELSTEEPTPAETPINENPTPVEQDNNDNKQWTAELPRQERPQQDRFW